MNTQQKKYDFDRVVRMVISIITAAAIIYAIRYLSPVLLPFLIGFLLAYLLDPLVSMIQRIVPWHNRPVAVVLSLVIVIGLIGGAGWLLVPYIASEVANMASLLTKYAQASLQDMDFVPAAVTDLARQYLDVEQIYNFLSKEQWLKILNNVATGTWSFVGGTLSVVLSVASWLIVLLYMFFVMLDFDKLSHAFKAAVPRRWRRTAFRVLADVQHTMSGYFRGQALVSLFVGIIFAIEFYIIGLPMAIVLGLFIGVLNMVPYLQLISIPIAAFLCLVDAVATGGSFWVMFGWTFLAYIICQVIQDLILIPTIMKQQMGLNPAIVFLSLSVWAYVLGFVGLIIGLPLTSLLISYYSEYVLRVPNPVGRRIAIQRSANKQKNHKSYTDKNAGKINNTPTD